LTPRGAGILLGCGLLLALTHLVAGGPRRAWPDLPIYAVLSLMPMLLATRVVQTPGAAAAACGAYLLPRTLVSLVAPSVEPPPLLIVPAMAFDLSAWLRASDLAALWPGPAKKWRKRDKRPRLLGPRRATLAAAVFGVVLAAISPAYAVLLGGDPSAWSGPDVWLAASLSAVACALVGMALSARGTES
jgi:hypothetical protein